MEKNNILVAAIQETKLISIFSVDVSNYTIVRKDRGRAGGGVPFIIHNKVQYRLMSLPNPDDTNTTIDQQAIAVTSGNTEITLINAYIPP